MINQKKLNSILKISLTMLVVLAFTNLIATNLISTKGQDLSQTNQEILALEKDNTYLENQIASETSLASLEVWAIDNQFVKISDPLTLPTSSSVAYLQ